MTRHISLLGSLKTRMAIHLLALLALIVSTLAPSGFMPAQTSGGFAIELCSGHANNLLTIAPDDPDYALLKLVYGGEPDDRTTPGSKPETSPCAFAFGPTFGFTSDIPLLSLAPLQPASHAPSQPRRFAVRNRIDIPPATGPPVTV